MDGKPWPLTGLLTATAIIVADQISKYVVVERVMRPEGVSETPFIPARVIEVLPIFRLQLSWNAGASFSLFNSGETMTVVALLAFRIAIVMALLWWLWRGQKPWLQLACGLIIGGALGNIIDVVTVGAVADFLLFHWGEWQFPTFNLADTAISVGAIMLLLDALFARPHDAPENKDSTV